LNNITNNNISDAVCNFIKTYYSIDLMKLSLISHYNVSESFAMLDKTIGSLEYYEN